MRRNSKGYALLSTMVIGMCAIAALMAIGTYVTADMQSEAKTKQTALLRTAAEAGLDYAIQKFNTEYPCSLDPVSGTSLESDLPNGYLSANFDSTSSVANNVSVKITVKKLTSDDWALLQNLTSIYDPLLDLSKSNSNAQSAAGTPPASNLSFSSDQWRVVESKASAAGRTKTYRAVLKPVLLAAQFQSSSPSTSSPLFKFGIFGNSKLVIGSEDPSVNVGISVKTSESTDRQLQDGGVGQQYKLKLASNQGAVVGNGAEVKGDVQVRSLFLDPSQPVIQNYGTIDGRVLVNNSLGDSVSGNNPFLPSDNVLANADDPLSPVPARLGENVVPVSTGSQFGADPYFMNPVATNGSSTEPIAPLSQIANSETPEITGGDWTTFGLSTSDIDSASPIQINNSSTPVRIFVQDSPQLSDAVNIDASKISSTGNATNLQIFYSGTKPVKVSLSGQTFKGLIYAPLAPVSTSGNGTFDGAIVGDKVQIAHSGTMSVHTELSDNNSNGPTGLYRDADTTDGYLDRWQMKPVTWEEVQ